MSLNYYIFENPNDDRKADLKHEIRTKLQTIVTDPAKADIILVLWGDGTMLDAIHKLYKYNKPFLGINCGTLWFLLNDINTVNQIPQWLDHVEVITEPFLQWTFIDTQWIHHTTYAINDIMINDDVKKFPEFTISREDKSLPPFHWSMLLLSSAIWSSWYRANNFGQQIPVWTNTIGVMGIISRPFDSKQLQGNIPHTISISSPRKQIDAWIDWEHKCIKDINSLTISYSQETFSLLFIKNGKYKSFAEKSNHLFAQKFEKAF